MHPIYQKYLVNALGLMIVTLVLGVLFNIYASAVGILFYQILMAYMEKAHTRKFYQLRQALLDSERETEELAKQTGLSPEEVQYILFMPDQMIFQEDKINRALSALKK